MNETPPSSGLTRWLTWANLLTAIRLILIAPTCWLILERYWPGAAVLFTAAAVSDYFDGKLARRFGQTSATGGLFDHATDALYVTAGCWALAEIGLINPLLPWLIPAAFVQYMLDSKALSGRRLRMSALGRYNGIAYFVVVGTGIGLKLLGLDLLEPVLAAGAWLLVATTIVSMLDRLITLVRHRDG